MIQSNQLRVGNLVYKDYNKKGISVIKAIHEGEMAFEPILLTPEILEKCGFKNKSQSSDYIFEKGDFLIGGTMKRLFPSVYGESFLEAYGNELLYIHQLQNPYFLLTGEELDVKLKDT